ncbi:MAG: DNA recombination protein RmuC, partial [Kiritimatiellae bacterium]|nr:DNA recombination protein RmuC [Kiritimatiellia bacterium]
MDNPLVIIALVVLCLLLCAVVVFLLAQGRRRGSAEAALYQEAMRHIVSDVERLERTLREELARGRGEQADGSRHLREELQGTLDRRLSESFGQVGERLAQVVRGLGEMQSLAAGVGDLKKVLTNVKTRGTWGEVQLGALLEQVLAPEQYAANVATRNGGERVEFAIRLPGGGEGPSEQVWLPIDAKFPLEDYQRLLDA